MPACGLAVVLSVELANEPHTSDDYERLHGLQPGSLIRTWACAMAGFIKSIDRNHLVGPIQGLGLTPAPWPPHGGRGPPRIPDCKI